MVTIFSGALSRTWIYENKEGHNYIKLFHIEDFGGERIKKKDQAAAVLQIKSAMENRMEWNGRK